MASDAPLPVLGRVKTCGRDGPEALLDVRQIDAQRQLLRAARADLVEGAAVPVVAARPASRSPCAGARARARAVRRLRLPRRHREPARVPPRPRRRHIRREREPGGGDAAPLPRLTPGAHEQAAAAALTWLASARRRPFPALGGAPATTVRFVGSCARALIRHAADAPATSFSSTPEGRPRASERPRSVPGRCLHSKYLRSLPTPSAAPTGLRTASCARACLSHRRDSTPAPASSKCLGMHSG